MENSDFYNELGKSTETKGLSTPVGFNMELSTSDIQTETPTSQPSDAANTEPKPIEAATLPKASELPPVEAQPAKRLSGNLSTKVILSMFDNVLLKGGGSLFYTRKLKTRLFKDDADFEAAENAWLDKQANLESNADQADRYSKYLTAIENIKKQLPLTPDEHKNLAEIIEPFLEETNMQLPPWLALVLGLGQVVVGRLFLD